MNVLSVRDFKSLPRELWNKISQAGKVTITVDLVNEDVDDLREVFQRLKATQAISRMRAAAASP